MIKTIFATKNKKSGNFNAPMFYDFPKENAAEVFTISAKETPDQGVEAVKELEVYYLGTLDTKTGAIVSEIEYIIDLGSVLTDHGKEN
jgi:hypothetical protein